MIVLLKHCGCPKKARHKIFKIKEKQAETHYRNSIYNGHQLHRFHHRQYFNFVRQRKSPGRPPRSAESFSNSGVGRKPGLLDNSLLNFSLSSFELTNQAGLPRKVFVTIFR